MLSFLPRNNPLNKGSGKNEALHDPGQAAGAQELEDLGSLDTVQAMPIPLSSW